MNTQNLNAGSILYAQGDQCDTMYILRKGRMALYLDFGTSKEFELINIGPGSCLGEMGLLENEPRNATAVALENCVVEQFKAKDLSSFIKENPEFARNMIEGLAHKLKNVTIELMGAHSVIRECIEESSSQNPPLSFREKLKKYSDLLFGVPKDVPPDLYLNLYSRFHGSMY